MNSENKNCPEDSDSRANPYLTGVLLGLVLLASYIILGVGLGASGAVARIGAWLSLHLFRSHTLSSEYFGNWGSNPLAYYLVFMFIGTFTGALISVILNKRTGCRIEHGRSSSVGLRLANALGGGLIVGFASRLARGCTSGQGLTGGALLLTGSLVFLLCIFISGYATAWLFRRQWND